MPKGRANVIARAAQSSQVEDGLSRSARLAQAVAAAELPLEA